MSALPASLALVTVVVSPGTAQSKGLGLRAEIRWGDGLPDWPLGGTSSQVMAASRIFQSPSTTALQPASLLHPAPLPSSDSASSWIHAHLHVRGKRRVLINSSVTGRLEM